MCAAVMHIMFASCTSKSITSVRVWGKEEEPKVDTEADTAEDANPEKPGAAADAADDDEVCGVCHSTTHALIGF